jgi:nucleoside-diphosphate-sugar epimerase
MLVTGASGFIGSHLTRRLKASGAEVHATSRSPGYCSSTDLRWWQGDLADIATVRRLLREINPEVIFHLAGLSTASPDSELVLPTLHSLLVSTVNLLTVLTETRGARLVLAASLQEPEPNGCEVTPGSPYAAAKWASGAYARMFHELYNIPVVRVRPFQVYGPKQDQRKLVPQVILSLLKNRPPKLSSGRQEFDWVYIDDVTEGFLAVATAPDVEGQTIDLGSGVLVPIRVVVDHIVELMESEAAPLFNALPDRPAEPVRVADMNNAYVKLGWKPRTALKTGLSHTIDWYRQRLQTESYRGSPLPV